MAYAQLKLVQTAAVYPAWETPTESVAMLPLLIVQAAITHNICKARLQFASSYLRPILRNRTRWLPPLLSPAPASGCQQARPLAALTSAGQPWCSLAYNSVRGIEVTTTTNVTSTGIFSLVSCIAYLFHSWQPKGQSGSVSEWPRRLCITKLGLEGNIYTYKADTSMLLIV